MLSTFFFKFFGWQVGRYPRSFLDTNSKELAPLLVVGIALTRQASNAEAVRSPNECAVLVCTHQCYGVHACWHQFRDKAHCTHLVVYVYCNQAIQFVFVVFGITIRASSRQSLVQLRGKFSFQSGTYTKKFTKVVNYFKSYETGGIRNPRQMTLDLLQHQVHFINFVQKLLLTFVSGGRKRHDGEHSNLIFISTSQSA